MDESQASQSPNPGFEVLSNGVTMVHRPDGSSYALRSFDWNPDTTQAASDIAEGAYSLKDIADRAGVSQAALRTWRLHPEFTARVEEFRKTYRTLVLQYGISRMEARMAHLQSRHDAIRQALEERGKYMAEKYPELPGASTGYIFLKPGAYGDTAVIDTKSAQLLADMEKQAAIMMGEWNEGTAGPGVAVQIVVPSGAPPAGSIPTVNIGTRQI